jgi:hypothetical protein
VSIKIPYKKYPTPHTACGFYYAASIPVNIALPARNSPRSKRFDAIIDSGASGCLFHASIGRSIGLELEIEKGEMAETQGVAGPSAIFLHDICLYAPGGIIATRAGFSDALPIAGLLGMAGFFENFKVMFDSTALRCELERIYQA